MAQVKDSKVAIHTTQVKVDLEILQEVVEELRVNFNQIGHRNSHEGRSRFSAYNNIAKFLERCMMGVHGRIEGKYCTLSCTGAVAGNTARVYYTPSVTSLAKPLRKAIVPMKEGNIFAFFDLKAAEFFLNCLFCNETEALQVYNSGGDIYSHYSWMFPKGTPREVYKRALIGWLYGLSDYTLAKQCGITETQAQRILDSIDRNCANMASAKTDRILTSKRAGCYLAPTMFDQQHLTKVGEIDPAKGFQPLLALSAWVQSALGQIMQSYIRTLEARTSGTLLTVFDSMLVEIGPNSIERYKQFVSKMIQPFRADDITIGKTFWEAAYGNV